MRFPNKYANGKDAHVKDRVIVIKGDHTGKVGTVHAFSSESDDPSKNGIYILFDGDEELTVVTPTSNAKTIS